ncbi:MAG TPA: hypothetical protein VJ746_15845 [Nitrospira sp.]|nr:hypothetical protein [Nitrospira sp.]
MRKSTIISHVLVMSLIILAASWAIPLANAAEQAVNEAAHRAQTTDPNIGAANSVEDSLKACLARIPEVATAGQHLLAEQNCRGEERMRQEAQVTPHF